MPQKGLLFVILVIPTLCAINPFHEAIVNNTIEFPGTTYYYSETPMKFSEASKFCINITGKISPASHLAVISSDEELERLQTTFKGGVKMAKPYLMDKP